MAGKKNDEPGAAGLPRGPIEIIGGRSDDTWGAPGTGTTRSDMDTIEGTLAPSGVNKGADRAAGDEGGSNARRTAGGRPERNDAPALGATGEGNREDQTGAGTTLSETGRPGDRRE